MSYLTEKMAYIGGLAEGLDIDETTKEGKLLMAIVEAISDIADEIDEIEEYQDEMQAQLDEVDEDLAEIEDIFYEDEDDFEESGKGFAGFFRKKEAEDVDDSFEEDEDDAQEEIEVKPARTWFKRVEPEVIQEEKKIEEKDDDLEILDLDMDDL